MSTYDWHVQSYLDRTGPYEMPIYDEKKAQIRHMQTFDFAGYQTGGELSHLGKEPFIFRLDMMHKELEAAMFKVKCVQNGLKHAPQDFGAKLTAIGLQSVPDWVAPPEGIQYEPGGMTCSGDFESGGMPDGEKHYRSKSRKRGAGRPIPEGCLDNARTEWENGQSSRDPGDM